MKKFLLFPLLFPSLALASALSKPVWVGPKAMGMGGAFVAVADDPTAIFHNPAGITQIQGHRFHLGMDALITNEDYTYPGAAKESAENDLLPVPSFGYVTDAAKYVSLGLGVFFPHGNGGKFAGANANFLNPYEGRIYSMEISPAVGWKVTPELSLGASLRIVRISSSLKGQFLMLPTGTPDTLEDLSVKGWGYGAAAGFLYKPVSWFSVGGNYRSRIRKTLEGSAAFTAAGTHSVSLAGEALPTLVTGGVAFFPTEDLTLGVSYDWERNSEIETVTATLGGAAGSLPFAYNYDDSHTIHFGGEYWLRPSLALRFGYAKDFNESIPDAAMNRIVGDIAAHELSLGLAYKWRRYEVGATWNARFGSRTIPDMTLPAPGFYQAFVQAVSVGVGVSL